MRSAIRTFKTNWGHFLRWQQRTREPGLTALLFIEGTLIFLVIPLAGMGFLPGFILPSMFILFVLATLVDNSGYASDVAAKYQAYFVAELPIKIGGQVLQPGVYGVGFIGDNKFVVTDIGAHDVFTVDSSTDSEMKRPMPMQVTTDPGGGFRLYAGRRYVTFSK